MERIPRFNRQALDVIMDEIERAIGPIKDKYGLNELSIESVSFSDFSFQAKFTGKIAGSEAQELDDLEAKFFALHHGLPEDILKREFTSRGEVFSVVRIETRNFKYPVIARCQHDGKTYKF
nr:hypothetical protein [Deltaproteobacteria bacterium]